MPVLLFQIALVYIIVHAVVVGAQNIQSANKNWFEIVYQAAIIVVSLWFLLDSV